MKSLLLSMVARLSKSEGDAAFAEKYPGAWLVWEPGSWKPAAPAGTLLLSKEEAAMRSEPPPAGEGLAFYLDPAQKRLFLGRDGSCQIVINDGTLSHKHLMFGNEGKGRWNLSDMGSSNGTAVDDEPLERNSAMTLRSGSRIKAGSVLLGFYSVADLQARARQFAAKSKIA